MFVPFGGLGETAFISWRGPDDLAFKKALGTSARSTGPLHDKNAVLPSAPLFVLIIRNHTSQGSFFSNPGLYSITNKLHVQQVHFKQDLHNLRKYFLSGEGVLTLNFKFYAVKPLRTPYDCSYKCSKSFVESKTRSLFKQFAWSDGKMLSQIVFTMRLASEPNNYKLCSPLWLSHNNNYLNKCSFYQKYQ